MIGNFFLMAILVLLLAAILIPQVQYYVKKGDNNKPGSSGNG